MNADQGRGASAGALLSAAASYAANAERLLIASLIRLDEACCIEGDLDVGIEFFAEEGVGAVPAGDDLDLPANMDFAGVGRDAAAILLEELALYAEYLQRLADDCGHNMVCRRRFHQAWTES